MIVPQKGEIVSISLDLLQISRLIIAFGWGIGYAIILHYTPPGKKLLARYVWLAVVIGVGVDLVISWNGDFITPGVFVLSSFGIIARSVMKDNDDDNFNPRAYKMKQDLEAAHAILTKQREILRKLLEEKPGESTAQVYAQNFNAAELVRAARWGK